VSNCSCAYYSKGENERGRVGGKGEEREERRGGEVAPLG